MPLVKAMKMTEKQMGRMAKAILNGLKTNQVIEFKVTEEKVLARATAIIAANFAAEGDLDKEVHRMMDDLERKGSGEFQRYKMFPMLKKRLAKEKGFVL